MAPILPAATISARAPTLSAIDAAAEPWTVVHGHGSLREARERAAAILASLGMEGDTLLRSRVRLHLSGGQRQRLILARSLLLDPDVLVLVEPTSAVDAHTEARISERLAAHRAGRTTVVVTASPLLLRRCD